MPRVDFDIRSGDNGAVGSVADLHLPKPFRHISGDRPAEIQRRRPRWADDDFHHQGLPGQVFIEAHGGDPLVSGACCGGPEFELLGARRLHHGHARQIFAHEWSFAEQQLRIDRVQIEHRMLRVAMTNLDRAALDGDID